MAIRSSLILSGVGGQPITPALLNEVFELFIKTWGYGRAVEIVKSLGRPCRRYTLRVNTLRVKPEALIGRLQSRGLTAYEHEALEESIYFLTEGPFTLPEAKKVVVADKYAAESVMQGAQLYAPGVLLATGVGKGDEVLVSDRYGHRVAFGVAQMDESEILTRRRGLAVKTVLSLYKAPSILELEEYEQGLVFEQSLPAMLTSRILEPKPGETIIDMCAAPGGKTSHIAQLMKNEGKIVAVDRSRRRLASLEGNMRRLGVNIVIPIQRDARYLHLDLPSLKADRVLVDPPCSTLGVRPKLYDLKTLKHIKAAAEYQKQFLKAAYELVKPNGVIVYSTCTLTPQENEEVIRYFLTSFKVELEEQPLTLGCKGLLGEAWSGKLQRFYPDLHDTPGYFIARLRKLK
ncbi:MAG: RsmB/NOP family class I SAM-dependent RNA methyltransferase [Candidatus Nezhaarchaeales archaeon]